ncbi:MAG: hypothetical protein BMS9Abin34_165 [Patescibacteria group bacterium]|nr:MAG: hypothetical protein BMS9Abin34_165 [Patescibacteria group bacterium]
MVTNAMTIVIMSSFLKVCLIITYYGVHVNSEKELQAGARITIVHLS